MDKQTLLNKYTMHEVIHQYGITPNRSGFINCLNPSHTDKNASCKVYEKNLYCHSCTESMNILDLCGHIHNETNLDAIIKHFCHDFGETYQAKQNHVKTPRSELENQKRIRIAKWHCRNEQYKLAEYRKQIFNGIESKQTDWEKSCRQAAWLSNWIENNYGIKNEAEGIG